MFTETEIETSVKTQVSRLNNKFDVSNNTNKNYNTTFDDLSKIVTTLPSELRVKVREIIISLPNSNIFLTSH